MKETYSFCLFYYCFLDRVTQGRAFVKKFDTRSRKFRELANELAFVFVFVKDGQPTSVSVKGYQGVGGEGESQPNLELSSGNCQS